MVWKSDYNGMDGGDNQGIKYIKKSNNCVYFKYVCRQYKLNRCVSLFNIIQYNRKVKTKEKYWAQPKLNNNAMKIRTKRTNLKSFSNEMRALKYLEKVKSGFNVDPGLRIWKKSKYKDDDKNFLVGYVSRPGKKSNGTSQLG